MIESLEIYQPTGPKIMLFYKILQIVLENVSLNMELSLVVGIGSLAKLVIRAEII